MNVDTVYNDIRNILHPLAVSYALFDCMNVDIIGGHLANGCKTMFTRYPANFISEANVLILTACTIQMSITDAKTTISMSVRESGVKIESTLTRLKTDVDNTTIPILFANVFCNIVFEIVLARIITNPANNLELCTIANTCIRRIIEADLATFTTRNFCMAHSILYGYLQSVVELFNMNVQQRWVIDLTRLTNVTYIFKREPTTLKLSITFTYQNKHYDVEKSVANEDGSSCNVLAHLLTTQVFRLIVRKVV